MSPSSWPDLEVCANPDESAAVMVAEFRDTGPMVLA